MRRWLVIFAVLAVVVIAIGYGFMPKPVPIETAKVGHGPFRETIEEEGKAWVKDRFVISSPLAGYVRRIDLEVGDPVKTGQVVATLESERSPVLDPRSRAAAEASEAAAKAALSSAQEKARAAAADAQYAKDFLEKQKKLFASGYVAKVDIEQAESAAKRSEAERLAAEAEILNARAELEKARTALKFTGAGDGHGRLEVIRSPVSGRVLKKHRESEGAVNPGDLLIDVGDSGKLEVRVEVLSADAVRIQPGTPVQFERWGGDAPLMGTVRIIEPEAFTKVSSLGVEEQRVVVVADFTSLPESWQRLGDGYRVEALFIIWEGKDVLQVPSGALFRKGDNWAVFVVQDGKARLRPVTVGHRNGLAAEIVSGLAAGDVVVLHPEDSVSDGVKVKVK